MRNDREDDPKPESKIIRDLKIEEVKIPTPKYQEFVSQIIARKLLNTFTIATILLIILGIGAILGTVRFSSEQAAESLTERALVPFLREAAFFVETIFGPLLAFILGFYFGKEK